MSHFILKYNQEARGIEGTTFEGNTWQLENQETGELILIDHVEIKVPISTIERKYEGKGFGMELYGDIEFRTYPNSEKKFAVIVPEK